MRTVLTRLDQLCGNAAAFALLAIVVINASAVFARYVLDAPFSWSEEVMRYANIWLTFLGAASAFYADEHMAIEMPYLAHWPTLAKLVRSIWLACAIALFVASIWLGALGAIANLAQRSPSAGILMAVPYAAVPVGSAVMLVMALYKLVGVWSGPKAPAE